MEYKQFFGMNISNNYICKSNKTMTILCYNSD